MTSRKETSDLVRVLLMPVRAALPPVDEDVFQQFLDAALVALLDDLPLTSPTSHPRVGAQMRGSVHPTDDALALLDHRRREQQRLRSGAVPIESGGHDVGNTTLPPGLYAIVDASPLTLDDDVVALTHNILIARPAALQLRAKNVETSRMRALAHTLAAACRRRGVPFIINDHVPLAAEVNADGVHLGLDDEPPASARRKLHPSAIMGQSTHASNETARAASDPALTYVAFGPVFLSTTKVGHADVQGLEALAAAADIASFQRRPLVAIGGINTPLRAFQCGCRGATNAAAISALAVDDATAQTLAMHIATLLGWASGTPARVSS